MNDVKDSKKEVLTSFSFGVKNEHIENENGEMVSEDEAMDCKRD